MSLQVLRKTTQDITQVSHGPSEFEIGVLPTRKQRSFNLYYKFDKKILLLHKISSNVKYMCDI
jgi:hypothetical protein